MPLGYEPPCQQFQFYAHCFHLIGTHQDLAGKQYAVDT